MHLLKRKRFSFYSVAYIIKIQNPLEISIREERLRMKRGKEI